MQEKDMVNDILSGTKASIDSYTKAIQECSSQQLRGTLKQLRDEAEQMQYQLYQVAEQKGYYQPAGTAPQDEISKIKNTLTSSINSGGSSGSSPMSSSSASTGLSNSVSSANKSNKMK